MMIRIGHVAGVVNYLHILIVKGKPLCLRYVQEKKNALHMGLYLSKESEWSSGGNFTDLPGELLDLGVRHEHGPGCISFPWQNQSTGSACRHLSPVPGVPRWAVSSMAR